LLAVCFPVLGLISYELADNSLNITYAAALCRFFPEFIIGMTTMRLVPLNADFLPSRVLAWIAVALLAFFAGLLEFDILAFLAIWLLLASLMMNFDAERPVVFGKSPVLLFLGRLSYSFYMSFGTVELILAQVFRHEGWDPAGEKLAYAAAMTVLTLALAVILHNLVEVPARRLGDKWLAEPVLEPTRVTL
jgi:peptidoglycan/LPS O-acetylase OafA/YrhL